MTGQPSEHHTAPPTDLRLYAAAVGAWLGCLGALFVPSLRAWAVTGTWALLAAVLAGVLLIRHRRTARRPALPWIAVALLVGAVCGSAANAGRTTARDAVPLAAQVRSQARVTADATLTDDPRALRRTAPGPRAFAVSAHLDQLRSDAARLTHLDARVLIIGTDPAWQHMLPGQRVSTVGRLASARSGGLTAAVLRATGTPSLLGNPPWTQRIAGRLRAGLQAACAGLPANPGGLLPGLAIGDTSRLPAHLEDDFRATGLTHLVAVSGVNVG
jgi:competence protein ComEC